MSPDAETPDLRDAIVELQAGVRAEANSRRIFERYYPWVRRFFERLGYAAHDAEDLAQETFGQVFGQLHTLRREAAFEPWLFAVAANLHRNERRRRHRDKRRAPEVSLEATSEDSETGWEPRAADASPVRAMFEGERRDALAKAVARLPPQMRQVFALRIDRDLKYREIATLLQISVETVKAHLAQSRQRLRAELGEDYGAWVE